MTAQHPYSGLDRVLVVDSHTEGEPTRVVIQGGPDLGTGTVAEQLQFLRAHLDGFRSAVVCEPRGSEVVVGALLCPTNEPGCATGVLFFNDVGYLGMCGHGTIGVIRTLAHLGRMGAGRHRIETPVGIVETELHADGRISVQNVPSFRHRARVPVDVSGVGVLHGDIAWGGNWFFLVGDHPWTLDLRHRDRLIEGAHAIRRALQAQGITGTDGEMIDHIELFGSAAQAENSSRNFVLCPGASFDRSPCGTGTSAKMACLYADGALAAGKTWRQEGILGTVFEGSVQPGDRGLIPTITARAWITAESVLHFDGTDPFRHGIAFA